MIPPLTLSGLYSMGGTGAGAAAGGAAAMGPIGWGLLGLSALGTLGGLFKKTPQEQTYAPAVKVGEKPIMNFQNPYVSPTAITGQDPYNQMMNPMQQPFQRPFQFSSALGRYGGLG